MRRQLRSTSFAIALGIAGCGNDAAPPPLPVPAPSVPEEAPPPTPAPTPSETVAATAPPVAPEATTLPTNEPAPTEPSEPHPQTGTMQYGPPPGGYPPDDTQEILEATGLQ